MSRLPPVLAHLPLPIIGSPLFIISTPKLVIAQCKAGVVGSMPALNARPAELLDEWLAEVTETLAAYNKANPDKPAAPFAINQIVHKSNDRLEHDMEMVVKYKVPVIITSLGARTDVNEAIHSYGGVVLHDIINNKFARKAIEKGADGLVAVAARAADAYKQAIVDGSSDDIVYSSLFTGVHGNYLAPSIRAAGMDPDNLPEGDVKTMNFGGGEGSKSKAWKDIWGCGQGIGAVSKVQSAGAFVEQLKREYFDARQRVCA